MQRFSIALITFYHNEKYMCAHIHVCMSVLLCVCLYHCTTIKYNYILTPQNKGQVLMILVLRNFAPDMEFYKCSAMACIIKLPTGQWLALFFSLLLYLLLPCLPPNYYIHLLQPLISPTLNLTFTLFPDFLDKTHKFVIVRKTMSVCQFSRIFFFLICEL